LRGSQIAALIFGALLLLPGGCFLLFGLGLASDNSDNLSGLGWIMILIAAAILSVMGLLFWFAFRKRPPLAPVEGGPPPAEPPSAPPTG